MKNLRSGFSRWSTHDRAGHGGGPSLQYSGKGTEIKNGLLSYPFLEERLLLLRTQAWLWSAGYALFLFAYGTCAWAVAEGFPQGRTAVCYSR